MFRLMLLSLLMLSNVVYAGPSTVGKGSRVLVIDQAISWETMAPIMDAMVSYYQVTKGPKVVDLVLNSPGGSVITGFEFLSLMSGLQSKGWKFRCTVYSVAASMAYQILNQCDQRQALSNSFLLWHRARVYLGGMFSQPITAPQASTLAEGLNAKDTMIFSQLQEHMSSAGATDGYLSKHFEAETLHIGANLSRELPTYLSSYPSIPGLIETLLDKNAVRTVKPMDFFGLLEFGEIIYIWD